MPSHGPDPSTALRGGRGFPTTRWSLLAAGQGDDAAARAALEALARRYWLPIARTVRARWARSDDEARELTQEFFLWMLEGDLLRRADRSRGRFRAFVKAALENFLRDRERRRLAQKRGGERAHAPLWTDEGEALPLVDPRGRSPEELFDDAWRRALLAEALRELEQELEGRGKQVAFDVFRDYYLAADDVDYAALAVRHGIGRADVSNALMLAKRRFRALLRALVLETVERADDLEAELRWLLEDGAP